MINTAYPPKSVTNNIVPEGEIDGWLNQADPGNLIVKSGPKIGERQKLFACVGIVHRLSKDQQSVEFAIVNYRCGISGNLQNKFCGGGSELNEKPIDVVKREVSEELELPMEIVEELGFEPLRKCAVYKRNNEEIVNVLIFFLAKKPLHDFELPEFKGNDDHAIKGREWLTLKKLLAHTEYPGLFSGHRVAISEIKRELIQTVEEYGWILMKSA